MQLLGLDHCLVSAREHPTAGVVGTGFVAGLHVDALRRLGVEVKGVVGSTPERARAKALAPAYESLDALLADDVDVVHVTTPNHLHYPQVKAVLAAGKHVVCEKPLALTTDESGELLELARASGLVHCTNFNIRFYPVVHHARALVRDGVLGRVWNVHGGYLQDWLALPTDWNWRLEAEKGGALRAVGDIGSHWLDLVEFVTGLRVAELCADLVTVIPVRRRPVGEVETFAAASGVERVDAPLQSEDVANILLRFEDDARGSLVVSQVSAGRRNSLRFQLDGSRGATAWDAERHEELWLGHRGRPNEILLRSPELLAPEAAVRTGLPAGHAEGFADTFKELYRAVYAAVERGGVPEEPDFPTFEDGHRAQVLGEAIAASNRERRWISPLP
jgi:predicted dehydrogenase